jgi:hypothetical protein
LKKNKKIFNKPKTRGRFFVEQFSHSLIQNMLVVFLSLFQMRGIWEYKDLEAGDTSSYFVNQIEWYKTLKVNPIWSPFDSIFGGSLNWVTDDPLAINMIIRLTSVAVMSVLVLNILRIIFNPFLAFFLALFWVFNPIVFDAMYQIHINSILVALLATYIFLQKEDYRNVILGISMMISAAVLSRNEYIVIVLGMVLTIFVATKKNAISLKSREKFLPKEQSVVAGLILTFTTALLVFRSSINFNQASSMFSEKTKLNFCQVYADYVVRIEKNWNGSQWTECHGLLIDRFNNQNINLAEAFFSNPIAVIKMILWHFSLLPSTFEILITGKYSGLGNPDYISHPVVPGLFMITIPIFVFMIFGFRRKFTSIAGNITENILFIKISALMIGISGMTLLVVITNIPRPEYLYFMLLIILIGIGWAIEAIKIPKALKITLPLISGAIITQSILFPTFNPNYVNDLTGIGQPLLNDFRSAQKLVIRKKLEGKPILIVSKNGYGDLCRYLVKLNPICLSTTDESENTKYNYEVINIP